MMREFKFRAWSDETKMMYHSHRPNGTNNPMWSYDSVFRANNHKTNIMQYTGIKDKNGKEIYEGDILRTTMVFTWDMLLDNDIEETEVITTVVEYQPPKFTQRRVDDGLLYTFDMEDFEVIGNIYENPEGVESDTIY